MRHVPSRAWLAAAVVAVLAAGCRHPDALVADMPGKTPASYVSYAATDASRIITPPAPPPRKIAPVRHVAPPPPPVTPADRPTHAHSAIFLKAEAEPEVPAKLDAPRPLAARRIATSDHMVYAHALDHRWLVGALTFEPAKRRWSLRYANGDEADAYGGILELIETGPMAGFYPGQVVRVEGELVDPQPYQIKPSFRVRSMLTQRR